ncbi:MAG: TonB-dependent receptor [Crocinitomicaceae bacterium]
MKGKILALFFVIAATTLSYAQGTVRGVVKDSKSLEGIYNALIRVKGEAKGTRTDFDGEYQLELPAGTYTLIYSAKGEGFLDQEKEILVKEGEVTVQDIDLSKEAAVLQMGDIVVEADRNPTASSIKDDDERRDKEPGPTDGISEEQIKQQGATNAVQAVQSVPGVTIEDGKSVYVRGLGDRYTKTILNGMEIPGLDPDRNSVQLDIFPTAVIANMTIYKTFLPNWTGDYTGGLVNITTKDLPKKRYIYAKAGLGYNNYATFNSNYLTYQGGKLDFLGFDDGTRALPVSATQEFPNPVLDDPNLGALTRRFGQTMAASQASQFLNQNYAFGFGNRKVFREDRDAKDRITYGYNLVANYRNSHQFFEDAEYGEYRLESNNGVPQNELEKSRVSTGQQSQHNVLWTALIGQSVKFKRSKIDLSLFHTQNAMSSAAILREENFEDNPATLERTSLEFTQRSVSNANLSGRHFLDTTNKWTLEWKLSPTYSLIKDPDIRSTALAYETDANGDVTYDFDPAVGAQTRRIWRRLSEYNLGGRFDFTYKFDVDSTRKSKINFGGLNTYRARDFEILQYLFEYRNGNNVEFSADPDWYFQDENIWTAESDQGMYVNAPKGALEPANNFTARQNIAGAYVMNEFPITEQFQATYGVRVEKAMNWYTGQNNSGSIDVTDSLVLDEWSVLPSVNLVYKIQHGPDSTHKYERKTNFRAAYTSTVARPSFKEKSLAQIFDPLQGRTYNGNLDLKQSKIHNFDARWEHFFGRTELVSASAFYKQFLDPIELIAFNTAPDNVQPLNTGTAQVFGVELEMRKSFGFNAPDKQHLNFVLGANYSYIVSRVDMRESMVPFGDSLVQEKELRQLNAREGQVIGDYRQMYGQSPYIVNGFATFKNDSLGLIINVNYNVQGKKLAVIGTGRIPDVFEQPFHSLNVKASKTFGSQNQWQASVTGRNLLLAKRQRFYESFGAENTYIYSKWSPGVSVSAAITYNLVGGKTKRKKDIEDIPEPAE